MKIQYIAVIFIIIVLPISMLISYYIGTQMDTLTLQTRYNTKLNDATYDAIKAFQINTVNNRYSSISDSKIRDIEASINTFFNSLSNSEQLYAADLKSYVPALVYTLYDGYYIYSKYDNVYPNNNGQVQTINNSPTNYGLKPYIYYSCRYKKGTKDFVVNYTLDNAIKIYGTFGTQYKTLSGYLINPNNINIADYNKPVNQRSIIYSGVTIKAEFLTEHLLFKDKNTTGNYLQGDYNYLVYNGQKIYLDTSKARNNEETEYFYYQNYSKSYITLSNFNNNIIQYLDERKVGNVLYSTAAMDYYYNAKLFSEQVIELIGDISQNDVVNAEGETLVRDSSGAQLGFYVNTGNKPIFDVTKKDNDPLLTNSTFNENRMAVIRKSIETNLTAAIANFNKYSGNNYEYSMPTLNEADWEKITNNVSTISFLQGIPIGHKYYNNYCAITNNNNEEVVKKENIYIIADNSNGQREYHLPGCTHLMDESNNYTIREAYSNLSFLRQTVRIAEGDYIYFYPQAKQGKSITACYYCIVNATNVYSADQIIEGRITEKNDNWEDVTRYTINNNARFRTIREYYIKALAREKWNLHSANIIF